MVEAIDLIKCGNGNVSRRQMVWVIIKCGNGNGRWSRSLTFHGTAQRSRKRQMVEVIDLICGNGNVSRRQMVRFI
jgi:hypothetical protein